MNVLVSHPDARTALTGRSRRFVAAILASALAAGCEDPFEPFQENEDAIFSMFGYLDLNADTQWVRVMPVRQDLLLGPDPIDAVVTLEQLGSGRVVTLNDSLFRFVDPRLDGVAYAHNFWTAEPLQPGASYRLTAARSDGASASADIVMPAAVEISLLHDRADGRGGGAIGLLEVRAEQILFVEMIYAVSTESGDPAPSVRVDDHWTFSTDIPGTHGIGVSGDTLRRPGLVDMRRPEIRVTAGLSDWPFDPELSDAAVTLPDTMPSNVENGLGFVGGVARSTIPYDQCHVLVPRSDREQSCKTLFNAESAAIAGRVIRAPCGEPHRLANIRLTERFVGGATIVRTWKTGWDGSYRFEGTDPAADLVLEIAPGSPAVELPRLAPGERHTLGDISVPVGC